MSTLAGILGATWTFKNSQKLDCSPKDDWCGLDKIYYMSIDKGKEKEASFPFLVKLGTWFLIVLNVIPISLMVTKEMVSFI